MAKRRVPDNLIGGRPKGARNKHSIIREQVAREAYEASMREPPPPPPGTPGTGQQIVGAPKDPPARQSLRNMRMIAGYFIGEAVKEQRKDKPRPDVIRQWLKDAAMVLARIAPYEFPTLTAVAVQVNDNRRVSGAARTFDGKDLSALTLDELARLYEETVSPGSEDEEEPEATAH